MGLFGRSVEIIVAGRRFGLRGDDVYAEIEKTKRSEPNNALIQVFNPDEGFIAAARNLDGDELVEVSAGYGDTLHLAFRGSPMPGGVRVNDEDTDTTLEIEALDGGHQWRASRVNQTTEGSTSAEEIIRFCADAMGVSVRRIDIPDDYEISFGSVLVGSTSKILDRIADSAGVDWSIQDGELVVVPDGVDSGRTAPLYTPDNGTLLSVDRTDEGIEARVLFVEPVSPLDPFRIESRRISGWFRAERVDTQLDSSFNDPFWQIIEAVEL